MALFNLIEIFDMVIMTAIVGYIFLDMFRMPIKEDYEPLKQNFGNWNNLLNSAAITAPAIIFHELAHKFVALSYGMHATFEAAYFFLFLGLVMKLMNFGFIFFIPAYVSISGSGTSLEYALIASAGPFMNFILWLIAFLLLRFKLLNEKYNLALHLSKRINLFLFVFNMLPIPGFDGSKFFLELIKILF